MKHLKLLLPNRWSSNPVVKFWATLFSSRRLHPKILLQGRFWMGLAGFMGFADASYLTILSYSGRIPPCRIVSGCEEVLTSAYAYVWGVPLSLVGAIYYSAILLLLGFYLSQPTQQVRTTIRFLSWVGIMATGYFLYLQALVLEAWCVYCLISAATSSVIFLASFWLKPSGAEILSG